MSRRWGRRRFDALELLLLTLFGTFCGVMFERYRYRDIAWVARSAAEEAARLRSRYGPNRYSRNEEEWVIRDYFQERRDGVFVDVGANHYRQDSNTYYLEETLGWSGVAIDPQAVFAADYRRYRPRTRFFTFFVSEKSDSNIEFYQVPQNPLVSSSNREFAERAGTSARDAVYGSQPVRVPTITLTDLLGRAQLSHFDLLSVDVELAEPGVLAGFDIKRFKPLLVCIEAHPQVRQQILDYFAASGYVVLGKYLRADLQNLYFAPAGFAVASPTAEPNAGHEDATHR